MWCRAHTPPRMRALAQHSPSYTMPPAHWHEIDDIYSQTFLLAQESSIDFHCVQNFAHTTCDSSPFAQKVDL